MRARVGGLALLFAVGLTTRAGAQADGDQPVPVPPDDEYADTDPDALTDFRGALDPYGAWVDDPAYGTVWTPSPDQVGTGFEPYETAGSWDVVDSDYVWVSDYEWGWVCFHYGRWAWNGNRWVWMSPSWGWFGGGATALGFPSPEPWAFATLVDFLAADVTSKVVTGTAAGPIGARTRPYTRAQPTVGGTPAPHGPPPALLGIDVTHLAQPTLGPREQRARQLARPSTAVPLGAHAPIPHVVRSVPRAAAGARGPAGATRGPAPHGHR
jgi:hypothetical protein